MHMLSRGLLSSLRTKCSGLTMPHHRRGRGTRCRIRTRERDGQDAANTMVWISIRETTGRLSPNIKQTHTHGRHADTHSVDGSWSDAGGSNLKKAPPRDPIPRKKHVAEGNNNNMW